jgi:hypothetical protein
VIVDSTLDLWFWDVIIDLGLRLNLLLLQEDNPVVTILLEEIGGQGEVALFL